MTNYKARKRLGVRGFCFGHSSLRLLSSFGIRHSSFPRRFMFHASRLTHHVSRITHHASRITFHASRFTFHVSIKHPRMHIRPMHRGVAPGAPASALAQ